jgi:hypothetical protein
MLTCVKDYRKPDLAVIAHLRVSSPFFDRPIIDINADNDRVFAALANRDGPLARFDRHA